MIHEPWVAAETEGFLVVHKPPLLHSAPLKGGPAGDTLLDWCAGRYPEVRRPRGRLEREGGLLHRLDYGTRGLVLIARTQAVLEALEAQQERGALVKEYGARTGAAPRPPLPGFPPMESPDPCSGAPPFTIASGFRPYGPGRRAVRPVLPGHAYTTEVVELRPAGTGRYFCLRIVRGFRHQIRCHLAWLGYPILGDRLYGGADQGGGTDQGLALLAQGLSFRDPLSGEARQYRLPPIFEDD